MSTIHEIILKRQSRRNLDPNRPVEPEKLMTLLEAARWAPSSANNQPWRFFVLRGEETKKIYDGLSKGNQAWGKFAPLIIVVYSKPDLDTTKEDKQYYLMGCGLAVENMLLQAIELGLVVHPTIGWNEDKIKELLSVPAEYKIMTIIFIGYPGDPSILDEITLEKERAPRVRKELSELVFYGEWGKVEP
jgi:nitroreductase